MLTSKKLCIERKKALSPWRINFPMNSLLVLYFVPILEPKMKKELKKGRPKTISPGLCARSRWMDRICWFWRYQTLTTSGLQGRLPEFSWLYKLVPVELLLKLVLICNIVMSGNSMIIYPVCLQHVQSLVCYCNSQMIRGFPGLSPV